MRKQLVQRWTLAMVLGLAATVAWVYGPLTRPAYAAEGTASPVANIEIAGNFECPKECPGPRGYYVTYCYRGCCMSTQA